MTLESEHQHDFAAGPPPTPPRLRLAQRIPSLKVTVAVALVSAVLGGLLTGVVLLNAPAVASVLPGLSGWTGLPAKGATGGAGGAGSAAGGAGAGGVGSGGVAGGLPGGKPVASLPGGVLSVVEVADRAGPSVVRIVSRGTAVDWFGRRVEVEKGQGSGFVIDGRGFIVTNQHVIDGADRLEVTFADGKQAAATVVGQDGLTDLAVLKVEKTGLAALAMGDSSALKVGETAIAIGNPLGLERTVTVGVISAVNRPIKYGELMYKLIQTDATINRGNSGGPLVNLAGQVIGITSAKIEATGVEGLGFAIPINEAKTVISELMAKGQIVRPWLGVSVAEKEAAAQYGKEIARGLLIMNVVQNGPAAKAGIRDLDVLLTIDGTAVNSFAELKSVMATKRVGDRVKVTVQRSGQERVIEVTLEAPRTGP